MHQHLLEIIGRAWSGAAAKRDTAAIASFHRIQASPGYRAAAHWVLQALQDAGLDAHIESHPARLGEQFWQATSFQEWDCQDATLDWLKPEGPQRLCDYRGSALAIIQRSIAASGEFDVVAVAEGRAQDFGTTDVKEKLVLVRGSVQQAYRAAVQKRGAAGILFDHITATAPGRSRNDLPDARQYASFWWDEENPQGWGFVLTPRQGDALRAALAAGERVRMRVHIDARLYDGELENVVATIPGTGSGALLATAHLCHPQDFANDNASGAAALLETARTLHNLIAGGQLPPPQRTLHFLWIPEMTGTYAWLARHETEIPNIIAGINLDMVGENQAKTGATLLIDSPPAAMPSFTPALLTRLHNDLIRTKRSYMQITTPLPLVRTQTIPFSGGSDHMITSDPTVSIPTPMLIQWPDSTYHTTADTMEMVDERSLWLAGTLAGSYLIWLANANRQQARWLGWEMLHRYEAELATNISDAIANMLTEKDAAKTQAWTRILQNIEFRQEQMSAALQSLLRLDIAENDLPPLITALTTITRTIKTGAEQQIRPATLPTHTETPSPWQQQAAKIIPQRLYRGPFMPLLGIKHLPGLEEEDRAQWRNLHKTSDWREISIFSQYWVDGHRSLAEIAQILAYEIGHDAGEAIETFFRLLEKAGLMRLNTKN